MSQIPLHETALPIERAVLVSVDTGQFDVEQSLDELAELSKTAGCEVVGRLCQKRPTYDKATCIGQGRLEELSAFCRDSDIDLIIFDVELTATQIRNIEQATDTRVIDRTMLILDIFAQRAHTREGKLQVELAQSQYLLPRLIGMGHVLSRQGSGGSKGTGVGTRGPGETKLESDRRHIKRRITALKEQLKELESRRDLTRRRRKKNQVPVIAIVGYTNVGKSTLLNALTQAGVLAENKLFATLDPTARELTLPDGQTVLLVDTVGLIQRLPHNLVEAFHSTLEEAANADLILHLCDLSSPRLYEQTQVADQLLRALGCGDIPLLKVYNKYDLVPGQMLSKADPDGVFISAKTGFGFGAMLDRMQRMLKQRHVRMQLLIPYDQGGLAAKIRQSGKVFSEAFDAQGIVLDALVDQTLVKAVEPYLQSDPFDFNHKE